jgi:hypothetical protein
LLHQCSTVHLLMVHLLIGLVFWLTSCWTILKWQCDRNCTGKDFPSPWIRDVSPELDMISADLKVGLSSCLLLQTIVNGDACEYYLNWGYVKSPQNELASVPNNLPESFCDNTDKSLYGHP